MADEYGVGLPTVRRASRHSSGMLSSQLTPDQVCTRAALGIEAVLAPEPDNYLTEISDALMTARAA
jgi:hypothetical protein